MSTNTDLPQRRTTKSNNHKIQPKTEPGEQQNEIESTNKMMKVQPDSQKPTTKSKNQEGADPCITIRWGVRAVARRQNPLSPGDLPVSRVDLVGGGVSC
ncbi:MAG: hypothetical protein ACREQ5_33585 [Candidatus Dormibacteria bacterium]